MGSPEFHLQNQFVFDGNGRISGTRSPETRLGPLFHLVRGKESCAWALRVDVPRHIADELDGLARAELLVSDFRDAPIYAERYTSLLGRRVESGPVFTFPEEIVQPCGTVFIEDIQSLDHHFSEWTVSEIPYRTPLVALVEEGYTVSVCFCAWRSDAAAEGWLRNCSVVSWTWTWSASNCWVGIGDSSLWSSSTVQYVMVQWRLSGGCS